MPNREEHALFTEVETAAFLGVAPRTLQWWRRSGTSPPYLRVSPRSIRYARHDLLAWLATRGEKAAPAASVPGRAAAAAREEPDG
jgi:Helix-turn-helix domain